MLETYLTLKIIGMVICIAYTVLAAMILIISRIIEWIQDLNWTKEHKNDSQK